MLSVDMLTDSVKANILSVLMLLVVMLSVVVLSVVAPNLESLLSCN
jgi:hypothetical protein